MSRHPLSGPAALVLTGVAALHVLWGAGAAWPAGSRSELADVVAGADEMPPAGACFAVAGVLLAAAGLTAGAGGQRRPAQVARAAVALGLLARGCTGVSGATSRLAPWAPSARFDALDRRWYGPLCLGLGSSVALAALADRREKARRGR
jgi:hypothetical protein